MSDLQDLIHTNAHNAFGIGVKTERERIIKLLLAKDCGDDFCVHDECIFAIETIELIQGEEE
jgi:hypothetical protein